MGMKQTMTAPTMTTRLVMESLGIGRGKTPVYVVDGPDGHTWLLKRTTEAAALADGLVYFLATRKLDSSGRWVLR